MFVTPTSRKNNASAIPAMRGAIIAQFVIVQPVRIILQQFVFDGLRIDPSIVIKYVLIVSAPINIAIGTPPIVIG